ncbi:heterokaryon incompatibility protein-domain-containing protein [Exophiala viscosa]|uniref:heterokaryon incompatibility protein-domain-containing protein n=1 Tax=Exophiala viscosa TaxID=2486360 RepID=UPI00219E0342|nr:heterokaryon incompatibility protein-domain-containing protein [Exophiala viscosa]
MPPKYLLNSNTLRLEHGTKLFIPNTSPKQFVKYAILSHRWGDEDQEVSFDDIQLNPFGVEDKLGYKKLEYACRQASTDGYSHIWIDTCCIDKKSSAELSESINSMYSWYENAEQCYAYLEDVDEVTKMGQSEWFDRGWTLQELIAPKVVVFFSKSWFRLGERADLSETLSDITKIDVGVLAGTEKVDSVCVARRMSWASKRVTSRPEDIAYCLMGIFNVNMSMLYGEGERAFIRLQEEIMKDSDDESIFTATDHLPERHTRWANSQIAGPPPKPKQNSDR